MEKARGRILEKTGRRRSSAKRRTTPEGSGTLFRG